MPQSLAITNLTPSATRCVTPVNVPLAGDKAPTREESDDHKCLALDDYRHGNPGPAGNPDGLLGMETGNGDHSMTDFARKPAQQQAIRLNWCGIAIRRLCYLLAQKGNPEI